MIPRPPRSTRPFTLFPSSTLFRSTVGAGHATLAVSVGRNGVILYENAGATYRAVLALTVPIAGWTHLAVGYDNGRPSVFLNGKLVGTGAASASRVHAMMGFPGARPRYFEDRKSTRLNSSH